MKYNYVLNGMFLFYLSVLVHSCCFSLKKEFSITLLKSKNIQQLLQEYSFSECDLDNLMDLRDNFGYDNIYFIEIKNNTKDSIFFPLSRTKLCKLEFVFPLTFQKYIIQGNKQIITLNAHHESVSNEGYLAPESKKIFATLATGKKIEDTFAEDVKLCDNINNSLAYKKCIRLEYTIGILNGREIQFINYTTDFEFDGENIKTILLEETDTFLTCDFKK